MGAPVRIPWDAIRTAYVEGVDGQDGSKTWPTLNEVAAEFGVAAGNLRERAARERWVDEQQAFKEEHERRRREERMTALVARSATVDDRAMRTAEAGIALVQSRLQEIAEAQVRRQQQAGRVAPINPQELDRLASAGLKFHNLAMRAVGVTVDRTDPADIGEAALREAEIRLAERVAGFVEGVQQGRRMLPTVMEAAVIEG